MPRPSAAEALFPHLKSSDQAPKQQQQRSGSLAESMYPPAPKPDPRDVWKEYQLELVGLRRVKEKR
jgi:hypothetical protein